MHRRTRAGWTVVAVAVVGLAGCAGGGDPAPSELTLVGTNTLAFEPDELQAAAGTVEFELTAEDAVEHTLVVEELDDRLVVSVEAGETGRGEVDLAAGTYTLYCDVPGHREAGMEAQLTVED